MKIKYVELKRRASKQHTWLTLWLMLPDFYTYWERLGDREQEWMMKWWNQKEYEKIEKFLEGTRLSLCRGSISFGSRIRLPNKRFSWTGFRARIFRAETELNTPHPEKSIRDVPISRISKFLSLLKFPIYTPCPELKDYVTLYILKRDYGKNIREV